jgi:hypothetical protein
VVTCLHPHSTYTDMKSTSFDGRMIFFCPACGKLGRFDWDEIESMMPLKFTRSITWVTDRGDR